AAPPPLARANRVRLVAFPSARTFRGPCAARRSPARRPPAPRATIPAEARAAVCESSCGHFLAQSFGNAQPRAARTRVARGFLRLSLNRLAHQSELRARMRRHLRKAGVHRIGERMAAHELLHHAILERMKADDCKPSVRRQALERGFERGFQLREFTIHAD